MKSAHAGKVGFAIGTGRCGTKFMAEAISREPRVAACHERNPLNETFHRYCQWYRLPVDHEGFLREKDREIGEDLRAKSYSFEASAHLSMSVAPLFERFDAKFLLLVRRPDKVVASYQRKGFFAHDYIWERSDLALGYQPNEKFHHFLGRVAPRGDERVAWQKLTRIGRIAWWWRAINEEVFAQFEALPAGHRKVQKLEELDLAAYRECARFLGFEPTLTKTAFESVSEDRPNAFTNIVSPSSWNADEVRDFEAQVGPLAEKLGYEYRVAALPRSKPRVAPKPTPRERIERALDDAATKTAAVARRLRKAAKSRGRTKHA